MSVRQVPLANWKFDVYFNDAHLTSVTTDSNGEAMLEGLQPGTYRIKETGGDTEHYNMDAPEQTVELIKDQAKIPTLTFENTVSISVYLKLTLKRIARLPVSLLKSGKMDVCLVITPRMLRAVFGCLTPSPALIRRRKRLQIPSTF